MLMICLQLPVRVLQSRVRSLQLLVRGLQSRVRSLLLPVRVLQSQVRSLQMQVRRYAQALVNVAQPFVIITHTIVINA